jgi:hypothetical protein
MYKNGNQTPAYGNEKTANQIISELKEQLNDAIDIIADVRSENINMVIDGDSPLITEQLRKRIQNILSSNGR